MGLILLFKTGVGVETGAIDFPITFGATTTARQDEYGAVSLPITFGATTRWQAEAPLTLGRSPGVSYQVAFESQPMSTDPEWVELEGRVRSLSVDRGRSYEFDRMEAGTMSSVLDNRDVALSPENSLSPYAPLKSTRPVRVFFTWDTSYPAFRGVSEGYPQDYPAMGYDAAVSQQANDLFYVVNQVKLSPSSTSLLLAMDDTTPPVEETVYVTSTTLPMPQAVPFDIVVDKGTPSEETLTVTEILSSSSYLVTRAGVDDVTHEHLYGAEVTTSVVSFAEELSGIRIRNVLAAAGIPRYDGPITEDSPPDSFWWDIDEGQSLIAASEDLAGTNPMEHINLVAEAEFGRFFVSREGAFVFQDRHASYLANLSPALEFYDQGGPAVFFSPVQVEYSLAGPLEHSEDKLYNHVRITIPSGEVVDMRDEDSIAEHFERTFERAWPYANVNDATSAATYILSHSIEHSLRLPAIEVRPMHDPARLWPLILDREIGERCRFRFQPRGGGDQVDKDVVIDGITHSVPTGNHVVHFQCTEVSSIDYWILGRAGYTELGDTTRVGF